VADAVDEAAAHPRVRELVDARRRVAGEAAEIAAPGVAVVVARVGDEARARLDRRLVALAVRQRLGRRRELGDEEVAERVLGRDVRIYRERVEVDGVRARHARGVDVAVPVDAHPPEVLETVASLLEGPEAAARHLVDLDDVLVSVSHRLERRVAEREVPTRDLGVNGAVAGSHRHAERRRHVGGPRELAGRRIELDYGAAHRRGLRDAVAVLFDDDGAAAAARCVDGAVCDLDEAEAGRRAVFG